MPWHLPRGSMHRRFLTAFVIALVPFALLVWSFQAALLKEKAITRQVEATAPLLEATDTFRADLANALTLLDQLEQTVPGDETCEILLDAVRGTASGVTEAGVYRPGGTPECAGNALPVEVLNDLPGDGDAMTLRDDTLYLFRAMDGRIAGLTLSVPDLALPDKTLGLALLDRDGRLLDLAGQDVPRGAVPPPGDQLEVHRFAKASVVTITVTPDGVALIATLDGNYTLPPLWKRMLLAFILPAAFVALSLVIASMLIRRLVLRDIAALKGEMADFGTNRRLSEPQRQQGTAVETLAMRANFHNLAKQLMVEEDVAQARLTYAKTLQREVFHRVSNNFQVILSIFRLIAREGDGREQMDEMGERIQLLSVAHHALHQQDRTEPKPIDQVMISLVRGLRHAGCLDDKEVAINAEPLDLPMQRIYSLLHLATEGLRQLGQTDATLITLRLEPGIMTISGNGGAPPEDQVSARLVMAFSRELNGSAQWDGNTFTATFAPVTPETADG